MIGISGLKFYKKIKDCSRRQNEIVNELRDYFPSINPTNNHTKHSADKSGKSKIHFRSFHLESGDVISTACFDWSKEMKYLDNLRIGLITSELNDWFGIAYN